MRNKVNIPKLPRRPGRHRRPSGRASTPYDAPGGVVRGDARIRSHRAPRAATAGRTATPARARPTGWGAPADERPRPPRAESRGKLAAGQPGRRVTPTRDKPKADRGPLRPSPRDRFARSTPMQRVEERERYIRGSALADRERYDRPGQGARRQMEGRADRKTPKAHPMSAELARPNTVGRGRAQRPSSPLRDPHAAPGTKPGRHTRQDPPPAIHGRGQHSGLAGVWFRPR